jgi:hypothetical protein
MFSSKLPHMLCSKCSAKVARDAYYCKSCGEVIDESVAPGSKVEDSRFMSKLRFAISRHLIRNSIIAIFAIAFIGAAVRVEIHSLQAVKDNGSSQILKLTVVSPRSPMTCRGQVCHINFDLKNKSDQVQRLSLVPDMVTSKGQKFGPADPSRMGNGINYCRTKIDLVLQPHETSKYLGICSADMPEGSIVTLAELRDSSGKLVVSGALNAATY